MNRYYFALLILAAAAALGVEAMAQPTTDSGPGRRVLGGHRFQPLERVKDPFVTTHLRTVTGGGIATGFETPFIQTDGDTLGVLEGDLGFFLLKFEYQKNLFDWGAVRVSVSGLGRTGIDEQSILADGLTTVYGLEVEAQGRVYRGDRSQVAVHVATSSKSLYGLDPFGFAQRIIDDGGLSEDNDLVKAGNISRYAGGAAGAYAFKPWLGGIASFDLGYAEPVQDDQDGELVADFGLAGSVDLGQLDKWPIGFTAAYDYVSFPEGGADVAKGIHSGSLGINYTGREDFHFGFETNVSTLKQTDVDKTLAGTTFNVNLHYYF
jgi:hypothetical protein